ncbi:MAG TPA: NfeD family protein [Vicinamibacterales bacterium]|nr:NfeD family protein [Vicinamibacterales bacterium]
MPWFVWMLLGLVLAALELLFSGSFFLIFFGLSALLIGTLGFLGLEGPIWVEWLLFAVLSTGLLVLFRSPLVNALRGPDRPPDSLTGDIAVALDVIPPGEIGRAELRGAVWTARNAHAESLAKGQRCRVERVDGLMLHLVPK